MARNQTQDVDDQRTESRPRRLKILGQEEIEELYGLPRFADEERQQYFSLTPAEKATLDELQSIKSKIAFNSRFGRNAVV